MNREGTGTRTLTGVRWWISLLLTLGLLGGVVAAQARPTVAAGDVGTRDFSFSAASISEPTSQKPQSKLWYTGDNIWWGSLFNNSLASEKFEIYRFNPATDSWATTGTEIDERNSSLADSLWDGTHLYVASAVTEAGGADVSARVRRYSYNPGTHAYTMDYSVDVATGVMEAIVLAKDGTGKLWVTYTQADNLGQAHVYVSHSGTGATEQTWVPPYIPTVSGVPAGATSVSTPTRGDISAVVAANGFIGLVWSKQDVTSTTDAIYYAIHNDSDATGTVWNGGTILDYPKSSNDHINLKTIQADASGRIFAALKTSIYEGTHTDSSPLVVLAILTTSPTVSKMVKTFGTVADDQTRPMILIDPTQPNGGELYMFATASLPGTPTISSGSPTDTAIYYKQATINDLTSSDPSKGFPAGKGTPFIDTHPSGDRQINNATSTKQTVSAATGLLVESSDVDSKFYQHRYLSLGAAPTPSPTPSPSASPSSSPSASPSPSPSASPSPGATVTLTTSASGSGTVAPAGTTSYTAGTVVQVTQQAAAGQIFTGWAVDGQPAGWANSLSITMNANHAVQATFVATPAFGDLSADNPAYNAIIQLAARGIIRGCDPTAQPPLLCPDDPTLREQMAALIVRAMPGWLDETGQPTFSDNTDDAELMQRVATLQRHGVVQGYQPEVCAARGLAAPCYGPLDTVKYGETLLFIARAMVQHGYWTLQPDDRTIFPDQNGAEGADPNTDQQTLDHRAIVTYVHYVGAPPDVADVHAPFAVALAGGGTAGWADATPRTWFTRALWPALDGSFGQDTPGSGGFVP